MGRFDHIETAMKAEGARPQEIVLGEFSFVDYAPRTGSGKPQEGRYRAILDEASLVPIKAGGGINLELEVRLAGPEEHDGSRTPGIGTTLTHRRPLHTGAGDNPERDHKYMLDLGWSCLTALGDPSKLEKAKSGASKWNATCAWLTGKECFVYVSDDDDPRFSKVAFFIPRDQYEARPGPVPEGERMRRRDGAGAGQVQTIGGVSTGVGGAKQNTVPEALSAPQGAGIRAMLKLGGAANAQAAAATQDTSL